MTRLFANIVFLSLAFAFGAEGQTNQSTTNRPITNIREVLELAPAKANQNLRTRVRGVVTCSDPTGSLCFLRDGSGGIFLWGLTAFPEFGDLIEVTGRTSSGLFSPILLADKIQNFGKTNLPTPQKISFDELVTGRHDAEWVEVEGIVQSQYEEWNHYVFMLSSGHSMLSVRFLNFDRTKPTNWVDSRVKIRGVAATSIHHKSRKVTGFQVVSQSTDLITVVTPAPKDPFEEPLRSTRTLFSYSRAGESEHRIRLRGIVTFFWPGRDFYIRDESGSIRIQSCESNNLAHGDLVEVVGFRNITEQPALIESTCRKIGRGPIPVPRAISVTEALKGELEGEIVAVEGKVLQKSEANAGYSALILEADQKVFRACFQDSWDLAGRINLVGAKVKVAGICSMNPPEQGVSESFSIWMREPDDFTLISMPPVWKQQQMMYILSGAGGAVALAGAWVFMLRLRVRRRTEEMQRREAALEERFRDLYQNANDIIYAHDLEGRILTMNNAGQVIFGYTELEFRKMSISQLLDPEDLEVARQHTREKLDGMPRSSYELRLRARDGRRLVFDVNSRLIFKDGQPVGVQGIARDITQRKLAEEALRVSERQLRASLEERERIARDLHDGIIQSIYAAGLNLEDTIHVVRKDPEAGENRIRKMMGDFNQIIREVRGFILGLERHRFKGEELKAALRALALTAGESKAAQVELLIDEAVAAELTADQATQILQIAREALSNSIRHSRANRLVFELQRTPNGGVRFELFDDGVGFNPAASRDKGFGLRNMAARAEEINASFRIFSQNGEGTRIVLDMRPPTAEKIPA